MAEPSRAGSDNAPVVVVEVDSAASRALDPRLTRRLIALELSDLDVPPLIDGPSFEEGRTLFVRVLGQDDDCLRVELWELGRFCGARVVPIEEGTSEHLRARRIALTVAILGRRLRAQRLREAKLAEQQALAEAEAERAAATAPPPLRLSLVPNVRAAGLPRHGWLAGPGLAGELDFSSGAYLALGAAWTTGAALRLVPEPAFEWREVSVTPGYAYTLPGRIQLGVGVEVAAASVHLTRVRAVDDIRGQAATWSARAALAPRLEFPVGSQGRLQIAPSLGVVLRPIPAVDLGGHRQRLGGIWMGGTLGWVVKSRSLTDSKGGPGANRVVGEIDSTIDPRPDTLGPRGPR